MTLTTDKAGFKKKIITFLLLIGWVGSFIFLEASENNGSSETEKRVKKGDFMQTVILTGNLKAQHAEELIVPYSYTWQLQIKWMVREGDYVKVGDPVVRFDTANLASDIENQEMSVRVKKEERAQLLKNYSLQKTELEVNLKQAEFDFKKKSIDAAVPRGITSDYDYDRIQLELKKSKQMLKSAQNEKQVKLAELDSQIKTKEIEIDETRVKLENLKESLNKMTLYAQTAGTMVYGMHEWQERKIQVGDTVFSTWVVATIPDNNSLQVEAWVLETDIHKVKPGQKVDLFLDAYPGKPFTGTVKDVLDSAEKKEQWGKSHYFRVDIHMDKRYPDIMKPGMSVKCIVHLAQHTGVLLIPLEMAYFDHGSFQVKPRGKELLTVTPIGSNEFWLAVSQDQYTGIPDGTLLEPVKSEEVKGEKN